MITFSICQRGESAGSGSFSNTSSPAPAIHPSRSARIRLASSIVPPRPMLKMWAVGFMARSSRSPIRWRVSGVSGIVRTTKSASGNTSSSRSGPTIRATPGAGSPALRRTPITCMSSAAASRAVRPPMAPTPINTSVLPANSNRLSRSWRSHSPRACARIADGRQRANASISARMCSLIWIAWTPDALVRMKSRAAISGWRSSQSAPAPHC